jgi:hypothetical protein
MPAKAGSPHGAQRNAGTETRIALRSILHPGYGRQIKKAAAEVIHGGFCKSIIVMRGSVLSLAGLAATYSSKS